MSKTGERYAAARLQLLARAPSETPAPVALEAEPAAPATAPTQFRGERSASDEALAIRTGHVWSEWQALLEGWGAAERPHPEIARWLSAEHGVDSWWSQELTVRYEMAIGRRRPGQRPDGFSITASKTVAVPVEQLFAAFVDESVRAKWLSGLSLRPRTSTPYRSARFDVEGGPTRIAIGFTARDQGRSTVALQQERLPDADSADRAKALWRERLQQLQRYLES
jgi:uncharacterized protein YndB with AHSA1/START domain